RRRPPDATLALPRLRLPLTACPHRRRPPDATLALPRLRLPLTAYPHRRRPPARARNNQFSRPVGVLIEEMIFLDGVAAQQMSSRLKRLQRTGEWEVWGNKPGGGKAAQWAEAGDGTPKVAVTRRQASRAASTSDAVTSAWVSIRILPATIVTSTPSPARLAS